MDAQIVAQPQPLANPARGDRVARTRQAIVASALTLALAGEVAPIVRDIAKMAGVSARTVFQHFADTAELYVAVLGRVLAAAVGELPDLAAIWSLDERIALVVNHYSERGERLLPMWTFVETLQRRSAEAADMMAQLYSGDRPQFAAWFDSELSTMSSEARERTLNALALALAPESWVVLRQRLGMSVDDARDELRFVARTVFNDASVKR
jgi:AcrR family transcriptional regulator